MAKNIEVTLTLNSKDFNSKLGKAKGSLQNFGSSGKVATGTVIGLAARLAPLAAGFIAVKSAVDGLSSSLRVSSQFEDVQITLTNIIGSAEGGAAALRVITEAAEELPFAFEELSGAAPALATVSDNIGELEDNIKLAADIAANFGIPFEVAAGQLQRSFSAGAGAADVFREKGVLAAAGFEAGVKVSIEETIEKIREFGDSIEGSAQTLNTSFSGATSQAGDALTLFQKAIGDAFRPEATAFLNTLVERFRENKEEIMAFAKAIGTNALDGFKAFLKGAATVVDIILSIGATAKSIAQGIKQNFGEQIKVVADVVVKAFAGIIEAISFVGIGLGKLIALVSDDTSVEEFFLNINDAANRVRTEGMSAIDDVSEGLGTFIPVTTARDAVNQLVTDFETGGAEIRAELDRIDEASKEFGRNTKINLGTAGDALTLFTDTGLTDFGNKLSSILGINPLLVMFEKFSQGSQIIDTAIGGNIETLLRFADAVDVIKVAFEENLITQDEYNRAVKLIEEQFKELGLTVEEIIPLIDQIDEAFAEQEGLRSFLETFGQAQKALSEDLATALVEGESAAKAFQSFFKKLVVQLIADALRLAIIQPILGSLFGVSFGAGGAVSGLTGGGLFGLFKADGGPVMANRPYIVGERGPELFVPGQSGGIVPNEALGMGGGTTVNYNIQAVDAQSFQALVAKDPEFIFAVTEAGRRRLPQ
tara:strand:+ start:300 stop:2420 length:2121 start_codon:yes stop_codon:yes gene_type:complete